MEPSTGLSLIIELEEKPYCFPSLWSNKMDIETIEVFQNNHRGGTDQKNFDQLRHCQKTDVNRRLLIGFL